MTRSRRSGFEPARPGGCALKPDCRHLVSAAEPGGKPGRRGPGESPAPARRDEGYAARQRIHRRH